MNMTADEGAVDPQEPKWRYDVFLTFRGADTRYGFAGNLFNALRLKGIRILGEDGALKSGDQIAASRLKALDESRISIVIFSENYAASSLCLDELAKIMERRYTKGQLVVPIFYQVDPSHVRHQLGSYEDAMARHEERLGKDSEKVKIWRKALSEITELSGWDFRGYDYEYELIDRIVQDVILKKGLMVPRYDVFLSFSGQDTRYSFTGYLYNALSREGFQTFMNDEVLEDGAQISESVVKAIEKSRISIIVFSENYAYSASRLDELVMILECMKMKNQLVWPIFYKVQPSDLRHQRNSYGKAMIAHENMFSMDPEKVQKWRLALSQAANLKGWHLKIGYEYEFIERIVEAAIKI